MAKKIYVISDDLILNEKIVSALDLNYLVKFGNYKEGIVDEIKTFNPDLIIIDLFSTSRFFLDLLNRIKSDAVCVDKKILVLSGSKKTDIIVGSSPKVKGYIKKPLDFEEVKDVINKNYPAEGLNIAVIDDDTEFSELMRVFIESLGHKAVVINNSTKAFDIVKSKKIDLIFLDLVMPEKDGFDVIMELSNDKQTSDIPIIVISAVEFGRFNEKGMVSGGYPEYISREISGDVIKEIIDKILSGVFETDLEKPKVLIADDEIELLSLIKESVENAGFIVFTASDGKEAVEKIYEYMPDVVVLDYNMPFKDGLSISQEIKNNPLYAHIPVVIVTAKSDKETKIKGLMMGIDDYLTKPVDTDELIARLKMIVKRNRLVLDTNPLSKLPGNPSIQARIEKAIKKGEKFAVLYIDLNNFKAYNDVYGFEAGDNVIKTLASIIVKVVMPSPKSSDFIGHIGGDDFIVLTGVDKAIEFAKKIISNFNQIVPSFYNEVDRKNGYITTKDRAGNLVKFPLVGVSIGIVHNLYRQLTSYAQVSHIGSELKKAAKLKSESSYVMDRRRE